MNDFSTMALKILIIDTSLDLANKVTQTLTLAEQVGLLQYIVIN